jgi:hypothetical protein
MKQILFFILLSINFVTHSQDMLFYPDGSKLEVKVLEVLIDEIKYLKWNFQEGPIYTEEKKNLLMILYKNGETEVFNSSDNGKDEKENNQEFDNDELGKNIVSLNPIHLFFGNITFAYERFYNANNKSIRFPLTVGYFSNVYFNIGSEIKYFKGKNVKSRYFLGPSFHFGANNAYGYYFSPMFLNGWSFQPIKDFNITLDGSIGPAFDENTDAYLNFQIGVSLGYRF